MHSNLYISYNLFLHSTSVVCNHKGNHILEGGCSHTLITVAYLQSVCHNHCQIPWQESPTLQESLDYHERPEALKGSVYSTLKKAREEWGRKPNTVS